VLSVLSFLAPYANFMLEVFDCGTQVIIDGGLELLGS